jgi:hypothetical protein
MPCTPELGDQPVDLAGGDAVDVGLLHDGDQRLLGAPAGLEERGEVRPGPQLWDGQLDRADPGIPLARAVAVALGEPVGAALAELGADLGGDLGLHQLLGHPGHALADHVGVLVGHELVGKLGSGHPWPLGHRGVSLRRSVEQTDDHEARGGRVHGPTGSARLATPLSPT